MNIDIYRIFNAVGDSILLCTLIKHLKVTQVTYNRAELDTIREVMKFYDLPDVKFVRRTDQGLIPNQMVDYVRYLHDVKVPLAKPNVEVSPTYATYQLSSHQINALDRSMTQEEHNRFVKYPELNRKDITTARTIDSLFVMMQGSKHHISIDSGTAWLSAAMGIDTTIFSKNSYYFADAYFYMKYINSQPNVEVHQQDGAGVVVANELQYNMAVLNNRASVGNYENYRSQVNERSRIRW